MGLTITRGKGDSIILMTSDGDIEITSFSNQTKLNITAPKSVGIWRKELLDENNELLPRDGGRGTEGVEQIRQSVSLHRHKSVSRVKDQATDQVEEDRRGVADTKENRTRSATRMSLTLVDEDHHDKD